MNYINYHKHCNYSNLVTPDSTSKPIDYINRAIELDQKMVFCTQHGTIAGWHEYWKLCKKHDLKMGFGVETYFVKDRKEKDRINTHLIVLAKNNQGKKEITKMISEANLTGYYYKARVDFELLEKLNPKNVMVTTACIGGIWRYDDYENVISKLKGMFEESLFLEVQYHDTKKQKDINHLAVGLSEKHNINLIAGMDSHFIYEEDAKYRDSFIKSKGIYYDHEEEWYMDFPAYSEVLRRFKLQNVLSIDQIEKSLESTNLCLSFESVTLDDDIKLPSIYPDLTIEQKNEKLKEIIQKAWKKEQKNIDPSLYKTYHEEVIKEYKIIEETGMVDYFLLNYEIIKLGREKGGILSESGRGCFTKDALIPTSKGMKTIDKINVGDKIINSDGVFDTVIHTKEYEVDEEMIEFKYRKQGSSYKKYKNICTFDHKILTKVGWKSAEDLNLRDFLVSPKLKINENKDDVIIDLNKFNTFGFEYDDKWIYEEVSSPKGYIYSPTWMKKNKIMSSCMAQKLVNGMCFGNKKTSILNKKRFYEDTPFKNIENYRKYCKKHGKSKRRIPRFITLNHKFNYFIGMIYGDGCTDRDIGIALAVNQKKYDYNSKIFYEIAAIFNAPTLERKAKGKDLIQIYFRSKIVNAWVSDDFFKSKKGEDKQFQEYLFNQKNKNLKSLLLGLRRTDGSINVKDNKYCFDNTSLSLIGAFRILSSIDNKIPLSLDVRFGHIDSRGYSCKEGYKVRRPLDKRKTPKRWSVYGDEKNWYLPVEEIIRHPKKKTTVYDIEVENNKDFMIGNIIVHNSAISFYTNKLLGFTSVDRIDSKVTMYPTRFMSKTRILQTRSLPDIDFNTAKMEPFIEAQHEIMGKDHSAWMITFNRVQALKAWKICAKSHDIDFSLSNKISKKLGDYFDEAKHSKKNVDISKYIDAEYLEIYEESKHYISVIESSSISPCSHLLYSGSIAEDVGLMQVNKEILCIVDKDIAEEFKYLKNDILRVEVVDNVRKVFEILNKPMPNFKQLVEISKNSNKIWKIYQKGYTIGINQVEQQGTTQKAIEYAPKSIEELCAFLAAIRPSFQSMQKKFINRERFEYGLDKFDKLLQTKEMPDSWLLYQEQIMKTLVYAGFPEDETYGILKAIAKKKVGVIEPLKERFIEGFIDKIMEE